MPKKSRRHRTATATATATAKTTSAQSAMAAAMAGMGMTPEDVRRMTQDTQPCADPSKIPFHRAHSVVRHKTNGTLRDNTPVDENLKHVFNVSKPKFKAFPPEIQAKLLLQFRMHSASRILENDMTPGAWAQHKPEAYNCYMNALAYVRLHPEYEMVVGSLGWRQPDGSMHWEFG